MPLVISPIREIRGYYSRIHSGQKEGTADVVCRALKRKCYFGLEPAMARLITISSATLSVGALGFTP